MVIESLGVYLPEHAVTMREVVDGCAVPLRIPLEQLTGIRSHRRAAPGEHAIDLARAAVRACLERSRLAPEAYDLLICPSITRHGAGQHYSFEPAAAVRLKAEFGFTRALAFDLTNGCAGAWTAILIAEALIADGQIEHALIVSGEAITDLIRTAQQEIVDYLDPQVSSLTVGDSGIAVSLGPSAQPGAGFAALDLYTLGAYSHYCVSVPSDRPHGSYVMRTDSLRLGARAIEHVAAHLNDTLDAAGWSAREVAHLVPHQTSEMTLLDGLKKINQRRPGDTFDPGQYRIGLAERGNTATNALIVTLGDALDRGTVRTGDRAVFCITGSGLSIGTGLYTFDDLPERHDSRPARRSAPAGAAVPVAPCARIAGLGLVRGDDAAPLGSVELARRAGLACLADAGVDAGAIELLVHAGTYKSDFMAEPAVAALAAGALAANAAVKPGAWPRTLAFDLMAGHLGTLKACWAADRLMRAGRFGNALVLTTDVEHNAPWPERGTCGLEPAGSAVYLTTGPGAWRFERFHFRDFTEHVGAFEASMHNPDGRPRVTVRKDEGFEARAAGAAVATARELLGACGLAIADLGAVLVPAGLPGVASRIARDLGLLDSQVPRLEARGDLLGSSMVAGLEALRAAERLDDGSRVLVLAVSAGIQAGCALLRP